MASSYSDGPNTLILRRSSLKGTHFIVIALHWTLSKCGYILIAYIMKQYLFLLFYNLLSRCPPGCASMARSFSDNYVKVGTAGTFSLKVFTTWDFNLMSRPAVLLEQRNIATSLKVIHSLIRAPNVVDRYVVVPWHRRNSKFGSIIFVFLRMTMIIYFDSTSKPVVIIMRRFFTFDSTPIIGW